MESYALEAVSMRDADHERDRADQPDFICKFTEGHNFGAATRIGPKAAAQQRKIAVAKLYRRGAKAVSGL